MGHVSRALESLVDRGIGVQGVRVFLVRGVASPPLLPGITPGRSDQGGCLCSTPVLAARLIGPSVEPSSTPACPDPEP